MKMGDLTYDIDYGKDKYRIHGTQGDPNGEWQGFQTNYNGIDHKEGVSLDGRWTHLGENGFELYYH
jgi:hypothetical protein